MQKNVRSWLAAALLILSFVGFSDAAYLTFAHYRGGEIICPIDGCDTVLTSPYATLGPVPLALLGALYYLAVFGLSLFYLESGRRAALSALAVLVSVGFVISLGLLYLQLFVIHAICLYCIASLTVTTLLFGVAWWARFIERRSAATEAL